MLPIRYCPRVISRGGEVLEAELLDQVLVERHSLGQVDGAFLVVLRIIVGVIFVPRRIVLGEVFLDGNLFGLLLVVFLGGFFLQYGVFLDLLLDALFELNGGNSSSLIIWICCGDSFCSSFCTWRWLRLDIFHSG